jgi:hypothetical protein
MKISLEFTERDWDFHRYEYTFKVPFMSRGVPRVLGTAPNITIDLDDRTVVATATDESGFVVVSRVPVPRHATLRLWQSAAVLRADHVNKAEYDRLHRVVRDSMRSRDIPSLQTALENLKALCTLGDPDFRETMAALRDVGFPPNVARTVSELRLNDWCQGAMPVTVAIAHSYGGEVMHTVLAACGFDKDTAIRAAKGHACYKDNLDGDTLDAGEWVCVGKSVYYNRNFYVRAAYLSHFGLTSDDVQFGENYRGTPVPITL